jgi:hypothetical protein
VVSDVQFIELTADMVTALSSRAAQLAGDIAIVYDKHVIDGEERLEAIFPLANKAVRHLIVYPGAARVLNPDNLQDAAVIAGFLLLHSEFVALWAK